MSEPLKGRAIFELCLQRVSVCEKSKQRAVIAAAIKEKTGVVVDQMYLYSLQHKNSMLTKKYCDLFALFLDIPIEAIALSKRRNPPAPVSRAAIEKKQHEFNQLAFSFLTSKPVMMEMCDE
jgi:hypothetical protein